MLYIVTALYLLAAIILTAWHRLVICKEVKQYPILRIVWNLRRRPYFWLWLLDGVPAKTETQKHARQEWRSICTAFLAAHAVDAALIVLAPLFLGAFFISMKGWIAYVLPGAVYIGMLFGILKRGSEGIIKLHIRTSKLFCALQTMPDAIGHPHVGKQHRKILIFAIVTAMGICAVLWLVSDWMRSLRISPLWLIGVLAVLLWLLESPRPRKKKVLPGVTIEDGGWGLEQHRERVQDMCAVLHIRALKWQVVADQKINAHAVLRDGEPPTVIFTTQLLEHVGQVGFDPLSPEKMTNSILMLLGHELAHIAYKDAIRLRRRTVIALLATTVPFIVSVFMVMRGWLALETGLILLFICLLFDHVFGKILTDRRYWGQMSELRADRVGQQLTGADPAELATIMEHMEYTALEDNALHRVYKRYWEMHYHPSVRRRIACMKKQRRWGVRDYISQLWYIRVCLWKGKGWYY